MQAASASFPAFQFSSLEILSGRDSSLAFLTLLWLKGDWDRYKKKGSGSLFSTALVFLAACYKCMKEVAILEKHCELQWEKKTQTQTHTHLKEKKIGIKKWLYLPLCRNGTVKNHSVLHCLSQRQKLNITLNVFQSDVLSYRRGLAMYPVNKNKHLTILFNEK